MQDQSLGTGSDGTHCSTYLGNTYTYTSCLNYGLGQPNGISGVSDTNYELTATAVDADNHVTVSYQDALGRTTYMLNESGTYGGTLTGAQLQTLLYNALDKPTSVAVEDLTLPETITTTTNYNDLGWATSVNDPDRGNHAYTFDADGRVIVDAVGSRTIGYVYDLLGRLGCVQDAYPSSSPTGICTGGNHLVQNTYDTNKLTVAGTTDYPKGQLTQSVALTIFPDSTSATTTETFEHDIRGQLLAEQMSIGTLPGSWNVTTALPTYQMQKSYNDANQLTQTQTSANGVTGYTTYPIYNSTNGWLNGVGKSSGATNLANYSYGVQAEVTDINFKTSTNGALLDDHFDFDKNLRVTAATATWQAGSGSSGNTLKQNLTYDAASNLTKLVTTQAAVPGVSNSGGSETQVFCYDEQNRLVWAGNSGTPSCTGNGTPAVSGSIAAYGNSFVYTNLGQLAQGPLAGSSTYRYLYCNSQPHELTGLYPVGTPCSNLSGAVYTSSYDSFGNVTSRTTNSVTDTMNYDMLDRMTNWSSNATGQTQQEQYVYDASGDRVLRRNTSGPSSGPTTTITTYAFGLEEHAYSSAGVSTSNLYYYFLGGKLIGSFDGTTTIFYLTDALGSVVSAFSNTASSAAIKGNQLFGPYGVSGTTRYLAGTINTAKGFTGQYNDTLTGLDYYNARYYDPAVGVFLSADTAQGNMQGANPYGYVNGSPETYSDPTGRYVVGPAGQAYYPGSAYYTQGGKAYSIATGRLYSGDGFVAGRLKPHLTVDQLNTWCIQNAGCSGAIHGYLNSVLAQIEQDINQGMDNNIRAMMALFLTVEGINEGDANAFMLLAEEDPLGAYQWLAEEEGVTLDSAVTAKLASSSEADQAEGVAGAISQIYSELDGFNVKFGPNGVDGEIDAETPEAIIEAKSGGIKNRLTDYKEQYLNAVTNPSGKPFVIYAPGWNPRQVQTAYQYLTSSGSGPDLYIVTNPIKLIEVLKYLQGGT